MQETGIGRTVNCLRKDDGEVGVAAKTLVMKWKAMVAADESSEDEGGGEENGQNDVDNHEGEFDLILIPCFFVRRFLILWNK